MSQLICLSSRIQNALLIWPHKLCSLTLFQEYMLMSHEVTCMLTFGDNLLLTGCANGNIIQWDIEKSQVDKV